MPAPAWLASIIAPLSKFIGEIPAFVDDLHLSKEEKAQIKMKMQSELLRVQESTLNLMLNYEEEALKVQRDIIVAEARGESWLQRNWRPLTMTLFGFIIAWNYVLDPLGSWLSNMVGGPSVPHLELPPDMWLTIQIGLGGYVVGRSAEKIVTTINEKKSSEE